MLADFNLWVIFTTGLFAGGAACIVVQGGLLATAIAQKDFSPKKLLHKKEDFLRRLTAGSNILPVISFLTAKLSAYTLLGALLGIAGQSLQLSLSQKAFFQAFVGLFMLGAALNMLRVHRFFRYFAIQPPGFLARFIRNQSKRSNFFTPAILGVLTIFIPCGATQAMLVLSIGTGNPISGAVLMFVFILGTTPVFFLLGYLIMKAGNVLVSSFNKFAAAAIIILATLTLNNAAALTGSTWTLDIAWHKLYCLISYCKEDFGGVLRPAANQTIVFSEFGYTPNKFAVNKGSAVTLNLINEGANGCAQAFTIPALNIQKIVPIGKTEIVTFKAPDMPGQIFFMCSMGMYRGVIEVM